MNTNYTQTGSGLSYLGRMLAGEADTPKIQTGELKLKDIKVFLPKPEMRGLTAKFEPDTERVSTNSEFKLLVSSLGVAG